jgi:hypothetical protein
MRLMLATFALVLGAAGTAQAQAPSSQAPPEQVVITPATEPRDGDWPFQDETSAPAPQPKPAAPEAKPAPAAPRATAPAPAVTSPARSPVQHRAAAPAGASPPAAAAAPTSRSDRSGRAALLDGRAAQRREAVNRAARSRFAYEIVAVEGRADDAASTAIAEAAGAGPLETESPIPTPVAARPAAARGPAAPAPQTDVTPLLLAIPLLFGAAVLAQRRGGVLRGRIRALVRRDAQTA